jgi:hypothetical protein
MNEIIAGIVGSNTLLNNRFGNFCILDGISKVFFWNVIFASRFGVGKRSFTITECFYSFVLFVKLLEFSSELRVEY